jgi:Protein of unknown function (DUF997)
MQAQTEPANQEQRLLRHARREGLIIMALWTVCLVWSVGSGYVLGYHRDSTQVRLLLGMPAWVFWSVVLPWAFCLAFSVWFCFGYMADDDLGKDPEEGQPHA